MAVEKLATMKIIVAVISLLCIANSNAQNMDSVFQTGYEYHYRYRAHSLSGMNNDPQMASYALKGKLIVRAFSRFYAYFQIEKLESARINAKLFTTDWTAIPYHFTDIQTRDLRSLYREFKVYYQNGLITHIETGKNESDHVVNLKKAIATPFQLQLERYYEAIEDYRPFRNKGKRGSSDPDLVHYEVVEDGIIGECVSKYVVESLPCVGTPTSKVFNVTKLRDYEQCTRTVGVTVSSHAPNRCTDCDSDKFDPLDTSRMLTYSVNHTGVFAIDRIESVAATVYMPLAAAADKFQTNHSQLFILKDVREGPQVEEVQPIPGDVHEDLTMTFPVADTNEPTYEDLYESPTPLLPLGGKYFLMQIPKCLKQVTDDLVASHAKDIVHTPSKAHQCARAVSYSPESALIPIFNNFTKQPGKEGEIMRRVTIDIFILAGTPQSLHILIKQIEVGEMTDREAISVLSAIPFYLHEPLPEFVDHLGKICSIGHKKQTQTYKTCWLAYAALVEKACGENETNVLTRRNESLCSQEQEKKYISTIAKLLTNTDETEDQLLYIQALGIMGLEGIVEALRPYVAGTNGLSEMVRNNAIYSLTMIRDNKDVAEEILGLASEILFNKDETAVIRTAAFYAFILSDPRPHHLQQLATLTFDENEDDELTSMIYSYLDSTANATTPCYAEDASQAIDGLSIAKKEEVAIQDSQFKITDFYSEDYKIGSRFVRCYVANNNSIFHPRSLWLNHERTIAGFSQTPFSLSIVAEGIESVLKRIFGAKAGFEKLSLEDIFDSSYDGPPKDFFNLFTKLNILPRDDEPLSVYIWARYLSHHNRMFYFDAESVLKEIQNGLTIATDMDVNYQSIFSFGFVRRMIPSSLGVPIYVELKSPAVVDVKGKLQITAPSFKELIEHPETTKIIEINSNLKPTLSVNLMTTIGTIDPFKKTYIAVGVTSETYVSLPHQFRLSLDLDNGVLTSSLIPAGNVIASENITVIRHNVQPITVLYPFALFDTTVKHAKRIVTGKLDEYNFEIGSELIGIPTTLHVSSRLFWQDQGSFLKYLFEDNNWLSLITLGWATPQFGYREYLLTMETRAAASTELTTVLDIDNIESKIHQMFSEGQTDFRGALGHWLGWTAMPWQCTSPFVNILLFTEPIRPSPHHSYVEQSDWSNWSPAPALRRNIAGRLRKTRQTSFNRNPAIIQEIPFTIENAEHVIKIKYEATLTGNVRRKLISEMKLRRNVVQMMDALESVISIENPPYTSKPQLSVTVKGEIDYPKLPCTYPFALDPDLVMPIKSHFIIAYGGSNITSLIDIKSIFNKTQDQLESEQKGDNWIYDQCRDDRLDGRKLSDACGRLVRAIGNLNRAEHTITYQYQDLSKWVVNASYKAENLLKTLYYYNMHENYLNVPNKPGQLKIVTEFSVEDPKLDVDIIKPQAQVLFDNVYYPSISTLIKPINARFGLLGLTLDDLTGGYVPAICSVMKDSLINFENVTYELKLDTCHYVITKDCSSSDLFSILISKSPSGKGKELEVHLLSHKVVLRPKPWTPPGQPIIYEVIVDGKVRSIQNEDPIMMLKQTDPEGEGKILAAIFVLGPELHLRSPHLGFWIKYDGEYAKISVSNVWRGNLCGACSEFDGETSSTFIGPQKCEYVVPKEFLMSYFVPSPHCKEQAPSPRRICPDGDPNIVGRKQDYDSIRPSMALRPGGRLLLPDILLTPNALFRPKH